MDSSDSSSSRSQSPVSAPCTPRSPIIPKKKRARVDDEIEEMLNIQIPDSPGPRRGVLASAVRDDKYYMEDGSCVLQVENTLFNVHKTLLSRDSSLFSDMFALPQGNSVVDGRSDDHPLVLHGDTVAEFKSFLWALYALPHELMVVHSPKADVNHLINIARISYKYHFKSIEAWALDAINDHVNRKDSPLLCISTATSTTKECLRTNSTQISRLMRLAQLCGHERLFSTMISLLRKLMGLHLHYAHLAMSLADELDLRALRGVAYFEVMQKAVVVAPANGNRVPMFGEGAEDNEDEIVDSEGRLVVTQEQQLRVLQGYYRLTCAWEKIRVEHVHFDHANTCSGTWHLHGCTQSWQEFWREKTRGDSVIQLGLADLLGRLKAISKEFDRWGSATYMHHDCRMLAKKAISEKIKQIEQSLPDFFAEEGM